MPGSNHVSALLKSKWGRIVVKSRMIAGAALGVTIVAGLVAPAFGAADQNRRIVPISTPSPRMLGVFTPASADPKLTALLEQSGLDTGSFRFTPSESRRGGSRSVTVAVRARTANASRGAAIDRSTDVPTSASVGLAPIAYNLGVSVGWKRFAVSGDVARIDVVDRPGSRESVDVGVSYTGRRFAGQVKATAERPLPGAPKLLADSPSYSIDVGGAYSLSRHLDLTAGVRYKAEDNRLDRVSDNRRDSQAVYIGTAIRF